MGAGEKKRCRSANSERKQAEKSSRFTRKNFFGEEGGLETNAWKTNCIPYGLSGLKDRSTVFVEP